MFKKYIKLCSCSILGETQDGDDCLCKLDARRYELTWIPGGSIRYLGETLLETQEQGSLILQEKPNLETKELASLLPGETHLETHKNSWILGNPFTQ